MQRKDKEVYASVPSDKNPFTNDPLHLYRIYQEKVVTLDEEGDNLQQLMRDDKILERWSTHFQVELTG